MDILTTTGINNLIYNFKISEQNRRIVPLETKKTKFSSLSSAWGDISSKLSTFRSTLYNLKSASSTSVFNSRNAVSNYENIITATASNNASVSAYTLRVNQLAKSDLLVSDTLASSTAISTLAGNHQIRIQSGDYYSNVNVELTGTETNQTLMEKISAAINSDKAVINSASMDASDIYMGSGEFVIDVGGTESAISYSYNALRTWDEVLDDIVSQINNDVSGVTAEKIIDGSNVSLQLTVTDADNYITIDSDSDTGTLLGAANLNIDIENEMGASGLVSASVFSPTSGNSKFSITAKNSGYDYRLIMSDNSGSALSSIGLTGEILSTRTIAVDDTNAGYIYEATSSTDNELNSKVNFNGINIQRNSNIIDDLVDNVTFTLHSTMQDDDPDVNINVSIDSGEIKSKIEEFISSFNDIYTYLKSRSLNDTTTRGIFVGDATASSLLNTLRNIAFSEVSGLPGDDYSFLSQIGISFDPASGLSISDSTKLENAINDETDQVAALFNSENGVAATLYDFIDSYIGSDGIIASITKNYDDNVSYLSDRITATGERIQKSADVLRSRYEALQSELANLMSTQSYFTDSLNLFM